MKKLIYQYLVLLALFAAFGCNAFAQYGSPKQPKFYGGQTTAIGDAIPCNPAIASLYYDITVAKFKSCSATNSWSAIGGSGGASVGSAVSGATQGSVFFAGTGGNLSQDNANFFYDSTAKSLKVFGGIVGDTANQKLTLSSTSGSSLAYNATNQLGAGNGAVSVTFAAGRSLYFTQNGSDFYMADPFSSHDFDLGTATSQISRLFLQPRTAAYVPLNIQLLASQTGDAVQILPNGSATPIFKVDANGSVSTKGFASNLVTITAATYAALATDRTICANSTSNAITVTLPTVAAGNFQELIIKDCNGTAATNNITVASAATIDGTATKILNTAYSSIRVQSTGAKYIVY